MHRYPRQSLVQIMAWQQPGAKPLSKPMLEYCEFKTQEQTSVKSSSEIHTFSFNKIHLKISSVKWRPFCLSLNQVNVLTMSQY